jgi:hypothetical protein
MMLWLDSDSGAICGLTFELAGEHLAPTTPYRVASQKSLVKF